MLKIVSLIGLLTGCTLPQNNSVASSLTLQNFPMGESRASVIPTASTLWASEPICSTRRTGYGNTRRAWFLETCVFRNPEANSLFGEVPVTIEYHLLEEKLIMVSLALGHQLTNSTRFERQLDESLTSLKANPESMQLSATLDQDSTLKLASPEATQVHALRSSK